MSYRDYYWVFVSYKQQTIPTAEVRWTEELHVVQEHWPYMYTLPAACTFETKLRAFQYSIIHRYTPHKKVLFRQGLVTEETCDQCP